MNYEMIYLIGRNSLTKIIFYNNLSLSMLLVFLSRLSLLYMVEPSVYVYLLFLLLHNYINAINAYFKDYTV